MVNEFEITAARAEGIDYFYDFFVDKDHSYIWGVNPDDIYKLTMRVSDDQDTPPDWHAQEYWGWYENKDDKFTMIYQNYCLLHTCFPYGIKAWEDSGKGKAYRLEIVNIKKRYERRRRVDKYGN